MKTKPFVTSTMILLGMLLSGCVTEKTIKSGRTVELGMLSFPTPTDPEWVSTYYDSDPLDFVVLRKSGKSDSPQLGIMVWQFRMDSPATSGEDIRSQILEPYREAAEKREIPRYDVTVMECDADESLTAVGILCLIEAKHDTEWSFWAAETGEIIDTEGHIYAFMLPDDDRQLVIIEYFQHIVRGVEPVDTKQLLDEFARNVTVN